MSFTQGHATPLGQGHQQLCQVSSLSKVAYYLHKKSGYNVKRRTSRPTNRDASYNCIHISPNLFCRRVYNDLIIIQHGYSGSNT